MLDWKFHHNLQQVKRDQVRRHMIIIIILYLALNIIPKGTDYVHNIPQHGFQIQKEVVKMEG